MAFVVRPTKAHGETTYVDEVTAAGGHDTIKAIEVDGDFQAIIDQVNGNLDNTNIAPTANISTSKIAQDAGLQTGHYADNSITSAKIADGTIMAVDLANDAITTTKILDGNVTLAKLGTGLIQHHDLDTIGAGNFTTEVEVAALASFTPNSTNSLMQLLVHVNGHISFAAAPSTASITARLKRNGTTIATRAYTLPNWPAGAAVTTILPWSLGLAFHDTAQTVAVIYSVTLEATTTGTATISRADGDLSVIEHR